MRHHHHLLRLLHRRRHTSFFRLHSSAAAAAVNSFNSPSFLPLTIPSAAGVDNFDSTAVAASFKSWFSGEDSHRSSTLSLLDGIYSALSDDHNLDITLSHIIPRLSECLVLQVLRHRPHPSSTRHTSNNPSDDLLLLRLRFFDWSGRGHPGSSYRHTRATYHAVFRILARAKLASVILDWLHLFNISSCRSSAFTHLNETLVIGYSVAGRPELAMQIFAKMRFQGLDLDSFAYHVLLNSLIESSIFDTADAIFDQIESRGLANPVTSTIKLKSLCLRGQLDPAVDYLRSLPPESALLTDRMVGTVVHALCTRAQFDEAARLVDQLGSPHAYGVLLGGLLTAGRIDQAIAFLKSRNEDFTPENFHYNHLIFQLVRKNRLSEVYDTLVEMRENGVVPDKVTMNGVLCFFCKSGMVDVAIQLYNSRLEIGISPTRLVYNYLITSLCRTGAADEICRVLEDSIQQGHFPERKVFNVLANVLLRKGKLEKVTKLMDSALHRNIVPVTSVLARYIAALCKAGQVEEACLVPQTVGKKTNIGRYKYAYTSLIHAFIRLQRVDVLPHYIIEMQENGHTPSHFLYREVVCCLCEMGLFDEVLRLLEKQLGRKELDKITCYNYFIHGASRAKKPELAKEVYNRMEKAGIAPNKDTNILMLQSYLKSRRIGDALAFFYYLKERQEPSNTLYNLFISGLCEAGKPEQAMVFWKEVRDKGMIPSLQSYEELIHVLCSAKDYDMAVKVLRDFGQTGRPFSPFLCNVLLLHTLKGQELLRAWSQSQDGYSVDPKSSKSGNLLVGDLIAAFSGGIRMKENLVNLDEIIEKSFPVDIFTYNMLLRGFSMAGRMDYACSLFHKISRKGYEPNRWTFDIMVHGFCRQGKRKEAEKWMDEMYRHGFEPTWYTMNLYHETR